MNTKRKVVNLVFVMSVLVTLLIAGVGSATEQKAIRKYPIPGHGTLEVNVPTS
jgi:hypothetical protein